MSAMDRDQVLLAAKDVAGLLAVSVPTLYAYVREGRLRSFRFQPTGPHRFLRSDVQAFIAASINPCQESV